jgi:hypothetical protein
VVVGGFPHMFLALLCVKINGRMTTFSAMAVIKKVILCTALEVIILVNKYHVMQL